MKKIFLLFFWGITSICFAGAIIVDPLVVGLRDNDNQPLSGGLVYTYTAGTLSAKTTWTDINKTSPAPNPIVLDAYGRATIYADGIYKFVVKTSDGITIGTYDNLEYTSTVNPTSVTTTALYATHGTIASLTTTKSIISDSTISSASLSYASLISPSIYSATSSGGIFFNASMTNAYIASSVLYYPTIFIATPSTADMASNKGYVDSLVTASLSSIATPTSATQIANKGYVDYVDSLKCSQAFQWLNVDFATFTAELLNGSSSIQAVPGMTFTFANSTEKIQYYHFTFSFIGYIRTGASDSLEMDAWIADDSGIIYDWAHSTCGPASYTLSGGSTVYSSAQQHFCLSADLYLSASATKTLSVYVKNPVDFGVMYLPKAWYKYFRGI